MLRSPRRSALRRTARSARRRRLVPLTAIAAALTVSAAAAALPAVASAPVAATATGAAAGASGTATRTGTAEAFSHSATAVPSIAGAPAVRVQSPAPLSIAQCMSSMKIRCYTPVQYRAAYNLNSLYSSNITGQGRTIVIVDSFGSPTIRHDLALFDQQWGFPNPTLDIVKAGKIPRFSPTNATMDGWAEETTLDVEYAHAIAPGARIVLVETPVAETEGVTGLPQMMSAEKTLIDSGVGDVISQSFGATENTFPGFSKGNYSSVAKLRYAFADAASHHVTVLAAAGDSGATDDEADGVTLYPKRVDSWPSSDPLVTSVGGTQLVLAQDGNKIQPDQVWNDGFGAGGGGVSGIFARPPFQNDVANVVGNRRGTPDIAMSGAVNGGCWVYESFEPTRAGWEIFGGTSEATPMFAGIVALADQVAHRRLGNINAALYTLGTVSQLKNSPVHTGIVDVTTGNNSFNQVTGYPAAPGYDLASGWGTIDGAAFVRALAQAASHT